MRKSCPIEECQALVESFNSSCDKGNQLLKHFPTRPVISCQDCAKTAPDTDSTVRAALFDSYPLGIILCCDRMKISDIEEALVHELVHAYDYSKNRCDFSTCTGLAFSEVRAAREAECSNSYYPFQFMRDICIRDTAIRSTSSRFSKSEAKVCVDSVFSKAMRDLEPFSPEVRSEK